MRQGQNNSKRSRGRGGRKPQHSANRAYDSNGPDVKIRGTAAHVCEKYQQLARDAISAGDRVTAENYYQHAEHYYRLLMAAQQGQEGQQRQQSSLGYRPDEDEESETEYAGDGPQPRHPGQPWHQQNGQNGNQGGSQPGNQGNNGQHNGSPNMQDEQAASSSGDDEDDDTADAHAQQGGEGEGGQPRRRNNRRRRPRGERSEGPRAEAAAPADSSAD